MNPADLGCGRAAAAGVLVFLQTLAPAGGRLPLPITPSDKGPDSELPALPHGFVDRRVQIAKTLRPTLLGAATQTDPIRAALDAASSRDARAALAAARQAWSLWQELDAPYEAARARLVVGMACRSLGDEDAVRMELDAARHLFEGLAASPDRARVESLTGRAPSNGGSG